MKPRWFTAFVLVGMCVLPVVQADVALERFFDGVMGTYLSEGRTVGAAVAVVQDGRLLVARGYGYADRDTGIRVQADRTLFRVGSISKVLLWMGVLQQIETGKLALDGDIAGYVPEFPLSSRWPEPVRIRHLMTHTAGFEDRLFGLMATGPSSLMDVEDVLREHNPERLWMPGIRTAYSNYGVVLAAGALSNVTGLKWDDYAERYITGPLNMRHTSTRQPLPDALAAQMSGGYMKSATGEFELKSFEYLNYAPAGSVSATATDMAKLMVELLNPRGSGVLSARSKSLMFDPAYVPHRGVNGMTFGMYETSLGSERAVGHGGDTLLFHARMVMWPAQNLGLFVVMNTDASAGHVDDFVATFAEQYGLVARQSGGDVTPNPAVLGMFGSQRRNASSIEKVQTLFAPIKVAFDAEDQRLIVSGLARNPLRFGSHPEEADVYVEENGSRRLAFSQSEGGLYQEAYFSDRPMLAYKRLEPLQQPLINLVIVGGCVLLMAVTLIWWPWNLAFSRGRRRQERILRAPGIAMIGYLAAAGWVGFAVLLVSRISRQWTLMTGGYNELLGLLWIPVVLGGVAALQLLLTYRVWLTGYWWVGRRLHFTLLCIAAVVLTVWCYSWRVMPAWVY